MIDVRLRNVKQFYHMRKCVVRDGSYRSIQSRIEMDSNILNVSYIGIPAFLLKEFVTEVPIYSYENSEIVLEVEVVVWGFSIEILM